MRKLFCVVENDTKRMPASVANAAHAVAHVDPIDTARRAILAPAALDENRVAGILGDVMGHAVDYADVYFQAVREESWSLEDGIVKDGAHSIDRGVGVRALAGERTGFAYSDEISAGALSMIACSRCSPARRSASARRRSLRSMSWTRK